MKSLKVLAIFLFSVFFSFSHARADALDPISESMCFDQVTFRRCYGVTKEKCLEWAEGAVQECVLSFPPEPDPPQTAEEAKNSRLGLWHIYLGHCSEKKYEIEHQQNFIADVQCSDLLVQRQADRKNDPPFERMRASNSVVHILEITMTPFLFGLGAVLALLNWRARRTQITFLFGFLSWILFVCAAFLGEIVSHLLFSSLYFGIGDNPEQVTGLMFALFASMLAHPGVWYFYRRRSPVENLNR